MTVLMDFDSDDDQWSQVMPSTRTEADRAGCDLYPRASCVDLVSFGRLHLRPGSGGRLLAGDAAGSGRARSSRGAGPCCGAKSLPRMAARATTPDTSAM